MSSITEPSSKLVLFLENAGKFISKIKFWVEFIGFVLAGAFLGGALYLMFSAESL